MTEFVIMTVDKPNLNDRVYDQEAIEHTYFALLELIWANRALVEYNSHGDYGDGHINLANIVAKVIWVTLSEDGVLTVDVEPSGVIWRDMEQAGVDIFKQPNASVYTMGVGVVKDDIVTDYRFDKLGFTYK